MSEAEAVDIEEVVPGLKYVIVYGNPVDGVAIEGPFDTHDEATEHAEENIDNSWWVTELFPPSPTDAFPPPFVVIDEGHDSDDPVVVGPFLYEPDAVTWAASGNDRRATVLWSPKQYEEGEHTQ